VPSGGRKLFVSQGCIACHGPAARGTNIAPSLIGVTAKFPGDQLPALLHHPTSKMRAGGMPAVTLDDAQMTDLVAYLSSLATASPAASSAQTNANLRVSNASQPDPAPVETHEVSQIHETRTAPLSPMALRGQLVFQRNSCASCHGAEGLNGTVAAPGLAGTASLLPASALENLLRHHSARMLKGGMPLTNFNTQDMNAIVAYIRSMTPSSESPRLVASEVQRKKN
jgi:mono/diheme cytochrome c family protein